MQNTIDWIKQFADTLPVEGHSEWWRLDGKYITPKIIDLEPTEDLKAKFPDGQIPVGQSIGRTNYVDNPHGIYEQVNYIVEETFPEYPYRVRVR